MGIITRIEDLIGEPLEALFDFHKGTQPVELERFLRKALEKSRVALIGKTYVANAYVLKVNADDFREYSSLAAELAAQLEQSVHEEAREQSYTVLGPVSVAIVPDRAVGKGKVQVSTQFVKEGAEREMLAGLAKAPPPAGASAPLRPLALSADAQSTASVPGSQNNASSGVAAAVASPLPSGPTVDAPPSVSDAGQQVLRRIRIEGPDGTVEVILATGDIVDLAAPTTGRVLVACGGRSVVLGRDGGKFPADVAIEDPGISRPHCSLRIEDGVAVIEDLGSTNGVWVNGERTSMPVILTPADEAVIGATRITVVRPG